MMYMYINNYIYMCIYVQVKSLFLKNMHILCVWKKAIYLLSSVHYMSTRYFYVLIPGAICIYLNKPFLILKPELRKYS